MPPQGLLSNFNGRRCSTSGRAAAFAGAPSASVEHPMFDLILVAGGIGLFGYLIYALIRPEKF